MTTSDATSGDEELLQSIIGTRSATTVVVERGPAAVFAEAVLDDDPVYRDPQAAAAAGFDAIPVTPTFPFVMAHWGAFPEIQPAGGADDGSFTAALRTLVSRGGVILHGEQEFTYHRPVVVGDVLHGVTEVIDAYQKESRGHTMTFLVNETRWTETDDSGAPVMTTRYVTLHRS